MHFACIEFMVKNFKVTVNTVTGAREDKEALCDMCMVNRITFV